MSTSIEVDDEVTQGVAVVPREREATGPTEEASGSLDRYVVLEQIGAGGMGVVHRAYDPKLRREVALKMLRFDRRGGSSGPRAETRILREARAMAQLSHANIVPVYDVEPVGSLVYIAMEYVDGTTLSKWLRKKSRPWREVVDIFRQAGRGLLAAHQTGIIHRDFKPSNVLMGNKGRVMVTDFGLARARGEEEIMDHWSSGEPGEVGGETVTESGEVVGTPAYMSPEQLRGDPVDARSDQYAFCVALFEGLYGRRPFAHKDPRLLLDAKEEAAFEPEAAAQVPNWLYRVVHRGLAPRADDRYASMEELLHALSYDPWQARMRFAWLGVGAVLAATVVVVQMTSVAQEPPCPEFEALTNELWGEARRQEVHESLLATNLGYAADTSQRISAQLETYASAWAEGYVNACEATRIRGEQSAEAFDLRMACLRRHKAELDTTVETLSGDVSVSTLQRAAGMVTALPPVEHCADLEALRDRGRATDPAVAGKVEAQDQRLARAKALRRSGRTAEASLLADQIEDQAMLLEDPRLHGEVMLLQGKIAEKARDAADAYEWYERAYSDAVQARHAPLAILASTRLVHWLGVQHARTAEAEQWLVQAEAWLRGREADDPLRTSLLVAEGELYRVAGRLDEARVAFERAVDVLDDDESDETALLGAHRILGLALMALGEVDEAEAHFTDVLELSRKLFGENHPDVGRAHQNLGATLYAGGKLSKALPHLERALAIFEQVHGSKHPRVAAMLGNLGALRDDLGWHDEARELFERALEIMEASEGTGSTERIGLRGNLAEALRHAGEYDAAVEHLRKAVALVEDAHGPAHPDHVDLLTRLGNTLVEAGHIDEARETLERAEGLRAHLPPEAALISADTARALGRLLNQQGRNARALPLLREAISLYRGLGPPLNPRRGETLLDLGLTRLDLGQVVEARANLEESIPLLTQQPTLSEPLARARFALARALLSTKADDETRSRALSLARDALAGLSEDSPYRAEVRDWLGGKQ